MDRRLPTVIEIIQVGRMSVQEMMNTLFIVFESRDVEGIKSQIYLTLSKHSLTPALISFVSQLTLCNIWEVLENSLPLPVSISEIRDLVILSCRYITAC